jgi:hypothetical protein
MHTNSHLLYQFVFQQDNMEYLCGCWWVCGNNRIFFNNVGNPVAQLDFFEWKQKSIILQGGLKLDYEIIKSLKFTSQYNGEYYTWKYYNYEDTKNIWLAADPSRTEAQYSPTAILMYWQR